MNDLTEVDRRKEGAEGTPVLLADGGDWLLAHPSYASRAGAPDRPGIDRALDRIVECLILDEPLALRDLWEVARILLKTNYDLADDEVAPLLAVAPGAESRDLAAGVLGALFAPAQDERTYVQWVRASLQANGLGTAEIAARDLPNVLSILVATNRTIPLSRFADVCRKASERATLEALI